MPPCKEEARILRGKKILADEYSKETYGVAHLTEISLIHAILFVKNNFDVVEIASAHRQIGG